MQLTIFQTGDKYALLDLSRYFEGVAVTVWGSISIDPSQWELTVTTDLLPLFIERGEDEGRVFGPILALDVLATWPGLTLYPGEPGEPLESCNDWGQVLSAYAAVLGETGSGRSNKG